MPRQHFSGAAALAALLLVPSSMASAQDAGAPTRIAMNTPTVDAPDESRPDTPAEARPDATPEEAPEPMLEETPEGAVDPMDPRRGEAGVAPSGEPSFARAEGQDLTAPLSPDADPVAAPAPASADENLARVSFLAGSTPGSTPLTLYSVRDGEAWLALGGVPLSAYEELCTAPCEAVLEQGRHVLAVGRGAGRPSALGTLDLTGDQRVSGRHIDHSGTRLAGVVLLLAGLATSGALLATSLLWPQQDDGFATGLGIASGVVLSDALSGGLTLVALNDGVEINFD